MSGLFQDIEDINLAANVSLVGVESPSFVSWLIR